MSVADHSHPTLKHVQGNGNLVRYLGLEHITYMFAKYEADGLPHCTVSMDILVRFHSERETDASCITSLLCDPALGFCLGEFG